MSEQVKMYGAPWCGDCVRSKSLLDRLKVDYQYLDVDQDDAAKDVAIEISGKKSIPVIVFPDGNYLVEPSDLDLTDKLIELNLLPASESME
jgi:mycoredoxin